MAQPPERRLVSEATLSNGGSVARSILNQYYSRIGHTHATYEIVDFAETVRDVIAAMITASPHSGLTVAYDDNNDRLTFSVTAVPSSGGGTSAPEIAYDTDGIPYLIAAGNSSSGSALPTELGYDSDSVPFLVTSAASVPTGAEVLYDSDGVPYMGTSAGSVPTGSEIFYDSDGVPYIA